VYSRLGDELKLFAGGTVERINIPAIFLVPEMVFHEDFDPYLPLDHRGIITLTGIRKSEGKRSLASLASRDEVLNISMELCTKIQQNKSRQGRLVYREQVPEGTKCLYDEMFIERKSRQGRPVYRSLSL
jgi:hypothetical protein